MLWEMCYMECTMSPPTCMCVHGLARREEDFLVLYDAIILKR